PSFAPGQFLTFQLKIPGQPRPLVRCYSLSDAPGSGTCRVSIKRVPAPRGTDHPPGLSSGFFHDAVKEGDILDVKAPAGRFVLDPADDSPVVLIAGGVGITPMLTMLNAVVGAGSRREIWLFYGVRHGGEQIMKEHLRNIARDHANVRMQVCYSSPREGDAADHDYQHAGRISIDLLRRLLPSNNYDFYVCGPPPLMDSVIGGLGEWGVPKGRVHFEKFGPGPPKKKPLRPAAAVGGPGIEVVFMRSGVKAAWAPATGTLLDLARAQGIAIESGCERGDCGTCQTAIRKGRVKYEENPAFDCEPGTCLVCCAVPEGPLELDI
ncbi:MAG: 2Fe-2S iron-sulfur cluster-binding protein, partial [Acidobacteriota bacterium]